MELAIFLFAYSGAAALTLAMARHHPQAFGAAITSQRGVAFRGAGIILLAASLAGAISRAGPAIGAVEWIGAVGLAAIASNLAHGLSPRSTPYLTMGAAAFAIFAVSISTLMRL